MNVLMTESNEWVSVFEKRDYAVKEDNQVDQALLLHGI